MLSKEDLVGFYFGHLPEDVEGGLIWYFEKLDSESKVENRKNMEKVESFEEDMDSARRKMVKEKVDVDSATKVGNEKGEEVENREKVESFEEDMDSARKMVKEKVDVDSATKVGNEKGEEVENRKKFERFKEDVDSVPKNRQKKLLNDKHASKPVNNKNCLSLLSCSTESDLVKVCLGLLGCRKNLKFYSQSRSVNSNGRIDLVYESDLDAENGFKLFSCAGKQCSLLSEFELGFLVRPFLNEAEMLFIIDQTNAPNAMKEFPGKVVMEMGKIVFDFDSLASVNMFVNKLTGLALGTLKDKVAKKFQVHAPKFAMKLSHSLPITTRHSDRSKIDRGWNWDILSSVCQFKVERGSTKSTKTLSFTAIIDLFKFWCGCTGRQFLSVSLENV